MGRHEQHAAAGREDQLMCCWPMQSCWYLASPRACFPPGVPRARYLSKQSQGSGNNEVTTQSNVAGSTRYSQQGELAVHALSDIDLEIASGEFVCLSGPSGSGKTTLLNMIGGLDRPSSGEITVAGQRLDQMRMSELAELRLQHIGFVFQAYNLIPVLSARENVEFVMQLQGIAAR